MSTSHPDETPTMKPWGWMVQYGIGMLLALLLATVLGNIPLFRHTTLAGTGLKAAHLVQFLGYGGALLLCWLLGRRIEADPPFVGAWMLCLRELVLPVHANHRSTLFAGQALEWMAKAAFLAGRSLARREVVMAGVTGTEFVAPVPVGHQLALRAWVSRVGRTSMTVCVTGLSEVPGVATEEVLKGVFEMVAVDTKGRPTPIDRSYIDKETA